jgi:glutathione S-transferase
LIKVYGNRNTRTFRALWALEELGLDYEHVPVPHRDRRSAEFLAINPNGRVPVIVDGDVTLFESMAVNLYLARRYGRGLWPKTLADEARSVQWSFWAMMELEPLLMRIEQREAAEGIQKPLGVLDRALDEGRFLLGGEFTIADLNVAAVLTNDGWPVYVEHFSGLRNVRRWFTESVSRPAVARVRGER